MRVEENGIWKRTGKRRRGITFKGNRGREEKRGQEAGEEDGGGQEGRREEGRHYHFLFVTSPTVQFKLSNQVRQKIADNLSSG
jgi:hypothetical protein